MNNKVYKIYDKETGKFSSGNGKNSIWTNAGKTWSTMMNFKRHLSTFFKQNKDKHTPIEKGRYEVVYYEMVETGRADLRDFAEFHGVKNV